MGHRLKIEKPKICFKMGYLLKQAHSHFFLQEPFRHLPQYFWAQRDSIEVIVLAFHAPDPILALVPILVALLPIQLPACCLEKQLRTA